MYEAADKLGLCGDDVGGGGVFCITSDSRQGFTNAAIAAPIVADAIAGVANPLASTYAPSRIPRHAADVPGLAEEVVANLKGYAAAAAPALTDVEDVVMTSPVGTGAIVQASATRKAAVYVGTAPDGTRDVRAFSALCGHMGCAVTFNAAERCFDCPCHGSCFDGDGTAVQGPATSDMNKVELPVAGVRAAEE